MVIAGLWTKLFPTTHLEPRPLPEGGILMPSSPPQPPCTLDLLVPFIVDNDFCKVMQVSKPSVWPGGWYCTMCRSNLTPPPFSTKHYRASHDSEVADWKRGFARRKQSTYESDSPGRGKWSKCGIFFILLKLYCNQTVWIFQLFSTVLKRFCPLHSKNVFVLILTHLEPELELFEVDDIGDDDL